MFYVQSIITVISERMRERERESGGLNERYVLKSGGSNRRNVQGLG